MAGPLSVEQVLAAEAAAIHDLSNPETKRIVDELAALATSQEFESERADKDADARSGKDEKGGWVKNRKRFYCLLNELNRAAHCCSGGGIRSATFCLGVIQALARHGVDGRPLPPVTSAETPTQIEDKANRSLLSRFHFLSTVSGGGYIGSWLSAWRHHDDFPTVWRNLSSRPDGPDVEPPEISWLRAYSNYLTPKVGVFSADSWTDVAIFLRNLLLNWLVIIPALAVVLLGLKLIITLSVSFARMDQIWWPHILAAAAGIACLIVAQAFTTRHRPTRRLVRGDDPAKDPSNVDQTAFLLGNLIWSLASAILLTSAFTSAVGVQLAGGGSSGATIFVGAILGVVSFAIGWLAGRPRKWQCHDFGRWAASGAVYGGLVGFGAYLFTLLMPYGRDASSIWIILIPVILGVPWVLLSQLLADMIFVGLVSYERNSDADREWLGRAAGWIAATAIIWIITTFLSFAGGYFLIETFIGQWLAPYLASAGGLSGVIVAWLGKTAFTPATPKAGAEAGGKEVAAQIALAIAGPLFAALLVVGISVALDLLLLSDSLIDGLARHTLDTGFILFWLCVGLAVALAVAATASRCVNINRFSLHALYRNRLVRAYLGASRQRRCPDKFTGFDGADNIPAHALWPPKANAATGRNTHCLFHVVNITLNVVKTTRLAWQQRKAMSFTASPLHCGAAYKGYRSSSEYGGPRRPFGLSLGTAMAISGAAASPNMGYHSSPSVTLLLALFNVRLGWWLGNPGKEGETTYKEEGPKTAIRPLLEETFGLTTDAKPWVYLSDGGHFENLGIYEMVRRRCRFILAIDAGCDPDFAFEDLGNALRKIYIDLGVRIRFLKLDTLKNRPSAADLEKAESNLPPAPSDTAKASGGASAPPPAEQSGIPYYAIGKIHYEEADGAGCEDGLILYVKPAYHGTSGTEGAGVRSYATAHKTFPHESTADQWFNEAQFESYRSLALDIMRSTLDPEQPFDHGSLSTILAGLSSTAHA